MALFASRVLLAEEMICGVGLLAEAHAEFTHKDSSRPATNSSIFVFILNIELYIWNTCIMYKFMIVISYHHAIMPHEYSFFS